MPTTGSPGVGKHHWGTGAFALATPGTGDDTSQHLYSLGGNERPYQTYLRSGVEHRHLPKQEVAKTWLSADAYGGKYVFVSAGQPQARGECGRCFSGGLDPKYLELEITKSIIIQETEHAICILTSLKEIGLSISIDDLRTEYSSLNKPQLWPIDCLKIDMQFVHGLGRNKKDRAIVVVISSLAKNLGLSMLAEGFETAPQWNL